MNSTDTFDSETLSALCSRYGLGEPISAPQIVTGGLIHRVFRLTTLVGAFAVKVLDPNILSRQGVRDEFRRSERIAADIAAAGVPAVLALEVAGDTVQDIAGMTVIVYPWRDGNTLSKSAAPSDQARRIGEILGRIHRFDLHPMGERPPDGAPAREPLRKQDWDEMVNRAKERGILWATDLEAALPDIFLWDRQASQAERMLPSQLVISHCDLDQKNVIWRDKDTPILIDWESAGPIRPAVELIAAALDWSGQSAGPPEQAAFAAVIEGYRQETQFLSDLALPALRYRLGDWLGWLEANMHRSLDGAVGSEQAALGVQETTQTLATMYALAEGLEIWAEWCV